MSMFVRVIYASYATSCSNYAAVHKPPRRRCYYLLTALKIPVSVVIRNAPLSWISRRGSTGHRPPSLPGRSALFRLSSPLGQVRDDDDHYRRTYGERERHHQNEPRGFRLDTGYRDIQRRLDHHQQKYSQPEQSNADSSLPYRGMHLRSVSLTNA